jgi:Ankyrin repeats (3 copies)
MNLPCAGVKRSHDGCAKEVSVDWITSLAPEILYHLVKFVAREDRIWFARTCKKVCAALQLLRKNTSGGFIDTSPRSFATLSRLEIALTEEPAWRYDDKFIFNLIVTCDLPIIQCLIKKLPPKVIADTSRLPNDYSERRTHWSRSARLLVAREDSALIRILHQAGFRFHMEHIQHAMKLADQSVLRTMIELACAADLDYHSTICIFAANIGDLALLQLAREKGYRVDQYVCSEAAAGGHIHILEWARQQDFPWDEYTCARAAETGNFEALKWAVQNGCSTDQRVIHFAARIGHMDMAKWALMKKLPMEDDGYATHFAIRENHLQVFILLFQATPKPNMRKILEEVVEHGRVEIMQWLHDNKHCTGWSIDKFVAWSKKWGIIDWALDNGYEWDNVHYSEYMYPSYKDLAVNLLIRGCPE